MFELFVNIFIKDKRKTFDFNHISPILTYHKIIELKALYKGFKKNWAVSKNIQLLKKL